MPETPPDEQEKRLKELEASLVTARAQLELVQQRYSSIASKMNRILQKLQMLMDDINEMVRAQRELDEQINSKLRALHSGAQQNERPPQ